MAYSHAEFELLEQLYGAKRDRVIRAKRELEEATYDLERFASEPLNMPMWPTGRAHTPHSGCKWPTSRSHWNQLGWPEPYITDEVEAAEADAASIAKGSVVYYMQVQDDPCWDEGAEPVKIGFSTNLRERVKSVSKVWGNVVVLATEPGAKATEELRHWQFMEARLPFMDLPGGSEFFQMTRLLDNYLTYLLDRAHGCPSAARMPLRGMTVTS